MLRHGTRAAFFGAQMRSGGRWQNAASRRAAEGGCFARSAKLLPPPRRRLRGGEKSYRSQDLPKRRKLQVFEYFDLHLGTVAGGVKLLVVGFGKGANLGDGRGDIKSVPQIVY